MDIPCVVGMLGEEYRRPILPQPSTSESMRCKRRLYGLAYMVPQQQQQHGSSPGVPSQPPTAVAKRNERERRRVRMVNLGFNALRNHVPNGAKNKKLSKVETLRSAIEYIRQLQDVVSDTYDERIENYSPPSSATPPSNYHLHHNHTNHHHMNGLAYSPQPNYGQLSYTIPAPIATSSGCSTASSPTPSLGSTDSQSPVAPDHFSSSEEEFLAINTWLA